MKFNKKIRFYFKTYFLSGINQSEHPEVIKQAIVTKSSSTIGYLITFILAVLALFDQHWIHASVLFITSFLFFSAYWLHKIKKIKSPYVISENIMISTLMILMLYLIYCGGVANTGPLWIYIIPPVTLFFSGLQRGLITLAIFSLSVCLMLFYPDDILLGTTYSFEFKSRLIYSFFTVTCLFVAYEYIREKSYNDLELLKQKFEQQAKHDMLSGLLNRRGMIENIRYEFKRNHRAQSDLSLIMCDIDKFKRINDEYGHEKGDKVIKTVARLFENNLREQDTLSRWGGEEFLFLLPMTDIRQATIVAEKLRKKIEMTTFKQDGSEFRITVSMGLYQYHKEDKINDMINQADNNLYKAKEQGRNCCVS
ncbi:MAG: GGDEF domain-containing protein [Saccharospirillaceae bacterium]|nr:GGDEF domain-containing protein [Pseudomonadales bacterium]NRB78259.1 GGDEF domain-containing protein [Saccharospirillaceae bacterium]